MMDATNTKSIVPYFQSTDLVAVSIRDEIDLIRNPILKRKVRAHAQDIYEMAKDRYQTMLESASFAAGVVQLLNEHSKFMKSTDLLRKYPSFSTLELDSVLCFAKEFSITFEESLKWLQLLRVDLKNDCDQVEEAAFFTQYILDSFPQKGLGFTGFSKFDKLMYAHENPEEFFARSSFPSVSEFIARGDTWYY